jgi:putative transposase
VPWTLPELRREWNRAKDQVAPWWTENSKEAYSSGLDGLARALKHWSDSRSGRSKGHRVGFPRFKKKGRSRDTCRFTTGAIKVLADRKHVQLPRIGVLKTHESTRSSPDAWSGAAPASWPPPSAGRLTAGSSHSLSRSNDPSR